MADLVSAYKADPGKVSWHGGSAGGSDHILAGLVSRAVGVDPVKVNYVAAKGAQLGQTRSWARDLAPFGITVNLVAPGWIPTERHAGTPPAELAAYAARVPMQRQGLPEDVGETVAYLASDAARFVTGQRLAVNGGNTLS